jgi:hypothetical protein
MPPQHRIEVSAFVIHAKIWESSFLRVQPRVRVD